jgi:uncharacterized RDD family membrane protein YckC
MISPQKKRTVEEWLERTTTKLEAIANLPRRRALEKKARKAKEIPYASFNDRVFASVIDVALSFILLAPVLIGISNIIYEGERRNPMEGVDPNVTVGELIAHLQQTDFLHNLAIDYTIHLIVFGIILLWLWNYSAATPGKWLLKMRIVDSKTFRKPSLKQFILRYLGYILSITPLTLGFAWIMFDKKKRAWHDMMAGTVVVKVRHWRIKDDGIAVHIDADKIAENARPDERE